MQQLTAQSNAVPMSLPQLPRIPPTRSWRVLVGELRHRPNHGENFPFRPGLRAWRASDGKLAASELQQSELDVHARKMWIVRISITAIH